MKKYFILIYIVFSSITLWAQDVLPVAPRPDRPLSTAQGSQSKAHNAQLPALSSQQWVDTLVTHIDSLVQKEYTKTVTIYSKVKVKVKGRHRRRRRTKTVTVRNTKTVDVKFAIGCSIYDLTDDSLIYSFNGDASFKPASTQKLFTAITALDKIGRKYKFRTTVYRDGKLLTDTIHITQTTDSTQITTTHLRRYLDGNILISGCYDPTITPDDILTIADAIRSLHIDSIGGRIIAAGFNYPKKNVLRPLLNDLRKDSILLLDSNPTEVSDSFLVYKNRMSVIMNLDTPFPEILQRMMKRSNNDYAEAMMRNICDPHSEKWSYDSCKDDVVDMLKRALKSSRTQESAEYCDSLAEDYKIFDGSGLSHSNRCTPDMETDILRYAYHKPHVYKYLYDSLPVAGVDGTLSQRMKDTSAYDNVRGKTGTIYGVSTLAGYATASNGHVLAFSIMVNDISSKNLARSIQDAICEEMTK